MKRLDRVLLAPLLAVLLLVGYVGAPSASWGTTAPRSYPYAVTRWHATARNAGWSEAQWPRLRCIINRESGGNPRVVGDHGTSFGLVQIHVPVWRKLMAKYHVTSAGLKNGWTNLRIARLIYLQQGWQPWAGGNHRC